MARQRDAVYCSSQLLSTQVVEHQWQNCWPEKLRLKCSVGDGIHPFLASNFFSISAVLSLQWRYWRVRKILFPPSVQLWWSTLGSIHSGAAPFLFNNKIIKESLHHHHEHHRHQQATTAFKYHYMKMCVNGMARRKNFILPLAWFFWEDVWCRDAAIGCGAEVQVAPRWYALKQNDTATYLEAHFPHHRCLSKRLLGCCCYINKHFHWWYHLQQRRRSLVQALPIPIPSPQMMSNENFSLLLLMSLAHRRNYFMKN